MGYTNGSPNGVAKDPKKYAKRVTSDGSLGV